MWLTIRGKPCTIRGLVVKLGCEAATCKRRWCLAQNAESKTTYHSCHITLSLYSLTYVLEVVTKFYQPV